MKTEETYFNKYKSALIKQALLYLKYFYLIEILSFIIVLFYLFKIFKFFSIKSHLCATHSTERSGSTGVLKV